VFNLIVAQGKTIPSPTSILKTPEYIFAFLFSTKASGCNPITISVKNRCKLIDEAVLMN